ncbi:MAG: glycosyl transferase family protein [Pseudomonadota bacterium]
MSPFWQVEFAQHYAHLETLAACVAVLIMVSGIDDLFIDAWYWLNRLSRRFSILRRSDYQPLTPAQLHERPEQPLAIMVPAWLEYDVIAQMLESMVGTLDYRHYVIFVGTYPNDRQTIAEVERMRGRYRQLVRVEVPHAGPTCKADCLNWIIQAIVAHEKASGEAFAGMVLHDSEDVLHPLELKFFNYLLPRKDMIQLPVVSLERNWYEMVAGTYMDEFAEWHAKDLVVREGVTGVVPSAGVGTCFSRRAIQALLDDTHNQPFNTESLTEDYDVGSRLGKLGMRSIFARFPVQFAVRRKRWFGLREDRHITITMPLCVRELFPSTLRTAYRQKARWVLGIGLQSWEQIGWRGSLATKYLLFRDRKGIVTSFVSILAYLLVADFLVLWGMQRWGYTTMRFPPLLAEGGWLASVVLFNACSLVIRLVQRVYFVHALYGWEQALMSVPRMVVGNVLNFLATARAWRMFLGHLLLGRRLVWDKTMHDFPGTAQLARTRQRLGELLAGWQAVSGRQLEAALAEQRERGQPLGSILLAHGWLDDETLAEALAYQSGLARSHPGVAEVRRNLHRMPTDLCVHWRVLALDDAPDGTLRVAAASPLPEAALAELATAAGAPVLLTIARESEVVGALRLMRGGDPVPNRAPLLGDVLVELGLVERRAFQVALARYRPDRDGRIGDYLVTRGVVSRAALEHGVAAQRRRLSVYAPEIDSGPGPGLEGLVPA